MWIPFESCHLRITECEESVQCADAGEAIQRSELGLKKVLEHGHIRTCSFCASGRCMVTFLAGAFRISTS